MNAAKLKRTKKKFKWRDKVYKVSKLGLYAKADPLEGKSQAKGIVLEKVQKEAKIGRAHV